MSVRASPLLVSMGLLLPDSAPAHAYDFGDAPAPYPTTLKDSGAYHTIGGPILGALVDSERDGQATTGADGDDMYPLTAGDDEDGVQFLSALVPGQQAHVQIVVGGKLNRALLDAWMDFGADGSWAQSGDQIFAGETLTRGAHTLTFIVPSTAKVGPSYARFRINSRDKLTFRGLAQDGEVEDYLVNIVAGTHDFGDAPAPYPTSLKDNGARHVPGGPRLGYLLDLEQDGQPHPDALGDDKNPAGTVNDEDGVTFMTALVPGQHAQLKVVASGNFDRALLDAWIDFGADGSWAQSGDQISVSKSLVPGDNLLTFVVPENARIGISFARFRISVSGKLSFTGEATNGEVEDYKISISQPLLDYGDAPYKYPTVRGDDGARHATTNNFCLGQYVDTESDGQPDSNALGDDKNPPGAADDEDGVTFLNALEPGKTAGIRVYLTAPGAAAPGRGYLDAWMDCNRNQSWADPGERILTNYVIYAGATLIDFTVPSSASTGTTYARFRLSKQGVTAPTGYAPDGEVEDYEVTIQQFLDFGDAPATYPTTLKDNGARHTYARDHNLGLRVDTEPDGQPSAATDGDDIHPSPDADDEDGVVFAGPLVAGRTGTVQVTASRAGRLYAWIDFNRNGTWADAGEKVFGGTALVTGLNTLTFNVPTGAVTGRTCSRWRFTVQGPDLDFAGPAPDGEVEDHLVPVIPDRERCDLGCIGRDFWLAFPGNYAPDPDNPPQLSLHVLGPPGVTGTVSVPGLGFTQNFALPISGRAIVHLPRETDMGDLSDALDKKGVRLTASDDVGVTAYNHARYTTDSYQALPVSVTGIEYVVLAYANVLADVPPLNGTQFAIAAAETNTVVTIVPSVTTGARPAGVPYALLMQAGETYQLRNTDAAPADLTGTIIKSDKPIAVFGGHMCTSVSSSNFWYCDHLVEQLLPVNTWGNDFYTAQLATRGSGDTFRFLAAYDGTTVAVNSVPVANLNRGQFHQSLLTTSARITATKPVLVAQFAASSDFDGVVNADPFMVQVQATRHYTTAYRFSTPTNDFPTNFVQIISPTAAVGSVRLDGGVVGAASFTAIPATVYSVARIPVTPGPHLVTSDLPFGASVYGWAEYDSYGHPACFYVGDVVPPQITPETPSITASVADYPNTPGQAPVPSMVGTALVDDNCEPELDRPTQNPPAGTLLGPGVHKLTLSLADPSGNMGEATVAFTVLDPSPVVITCPNDMVVNCNTNGGAYVRFAVNARTTYDPTVPVVSTPPSGSFFAVGSTVVTNVATSLAGQSNVCYFKVTVVCDNRIRIAPGPRGTELTWSGAGTLMRAATLRGPWTPVVEGVSSYIIAPTNKESYFRVRF